jgi:hypothetical protein
MDIADSGAVLYGIRVSQHGFEGATIMHDLFVATVIFHALATVTLFGVCAAHAVHDPLRRRAPSRQVLIEEPARSTPPESFGLRVLHNRLVGAQILKVHAEAG